MDSKTKEYLVSMVITFGTSFLMVLSTSLDNLTIQDVKNGALLGVIFTAIRTSIRVIVHQFTYPQESDIELK